MKIQNFQLRTTVPGLKLAMIALMASLFLTNCKKDTSSLVPKAEDVQSKVIAWLDKNKTGINKISQTNIDLLKQNLDFSAATSGPRSNLFDLLIVPIKTGLNSRMNFDNTATLNLMLVTDKTGKIKSGNIVGFLPADKIRRSALSVDQFQGIFGSKKVTENGLFKFLSVTGTLSYQLEYKNKKLVSSGVVQSHKPGNKIAADDCTDWFLVTTYYYADGSSESDSQYLFTTCISAEDLPPGGGGGGSSGITVTEEVTFEDDEISNFSDEDISDAGGYVPIHYFYHADIVRDEETNEIESVEVSPMTAQPIYSDYIDRYGRSVTRYLTVWGTFSTYNILSPTSVMLQWSGQITGRYTFTDNTPSWTSTWSKSKSEVR